MRYFFFKNRVKSERKKGEEGDVEGEGEGEGEIGRSGLRR